MKNAITCRGIGDMPGQKQVRCAVTGGFVQIDFLGRVWYNSDAPTDS
jgi:hypothetical protein